MPEEILYPIATLVAGGLVWGGKLAVQRWISARIDSRFDERLESHKHSLQLIAERTKYEHQRDLASFGHLISRRFVAVDEVFSKARIAHGLVAGLFGLREAPTFEAFDAADINRHMKDRDIPQGKRQEVLALWDSDRTAAKDLMSPVLRQADVLQARVALTEAKNSTYLNELYLPKDALKALDGLFSHLENWIFSARYPDYGLDRKISKEQLREALDEVRDSLRADLSSGSVLGPAKLEEDPPQKQIGTVSD